MSPTAEEITKQDIIDQLTWDHSVNANEIYVNVQDDVVQLKGKVPTYASKIAAEKDVYEVSGVTWVQNHLEVESPPDITRPTDLEITETIENKLAWNSQINSASIKVKTKDGIVTLSGVVDSYWEKNLAEDTALFTNGVIEVIDDLSVSLVKTVVDIDIEKDIKNAYRRNRLPGREEISVSVQNGIVRLSGVVPGFSVKKEAYNIAAYTAGVVDVIDDITVG